MILKKVSCSDLETMEIYGQVRHEKLNKQKHPKRFEKENTENQNLQEPSTSTPMLSTNEMKYEELIEIIMIEMKSYKKGKKKVWKSVKNYKPDNIMEQAI